jgi:hypothetical protein
MKGGSVMEPRHEGPKDKVPRTEEKEAKPRRFRIVKLEERIAPGKGGNGNGSTSCHPDLGCSGTSCRGPHCC